MYRLKKQTIVFSLIVIVLILVTGNYSLNSLLPKNLQKIIPTPTVKPTNEVNETKISKESQNFEYTKVIKIIDGDTIEIDNGQKVRYIGINAPETVDPRKEVQCFGEQASAKNKELVEGKTIKIEKDISETDKYGRLLRYVYVDNKMINEQLVAEGYAYATAYPPDIKYQQIFKTAERDARDNNRGLWKSCN